MSKFFIVFICFLLTGFTRAQVSLSDSFNLALTNAKHDTSRCFILNLFGEAVYLENPDSALKLWTSAQKLAEKNLAGEPSAQGRDLKSGRSSFIPGFFHYF